MLFTDGLTSANKVKEQRRNASCVIDRFLDRNYPKQINIVTPVNGEIDSREFQH
jgi:hypothetical protein